MHIYETSTLTTRLHPAEGRAVVLIGGTGGEVTLFADSADLVRLRDMFAEVVAELDAARARLAAELTAADTAA